MRCFELRRVPPSQQYGNIQTWHSCLLTALREIRKIHVRATHGVDGNLKNDPVNGMFSYRLIGETWPAYSEKHSELPLPKKFKQRPNRYPWYPAPQNPNAVVSVVLKLFVAVEQMCGFHKELCPRHTCCTHQTLTTNDLDLSKHGTSSCQKRTFLTMHALLRSDHLGTLRQLERFHTAGS